MVVDLKNKEISNVVTEIFGNLNEEQQKVMIKVMQELGYYIS